MRILGIDPGSVVTGWGVVHHGEGSALHVAHGVLRPERGGAMPDRLAFIHAGLVEVIREHVPEIAVVERVFVAANPRSALVLGQARGVALAALGAAGIVVEEVAAREVKQALVGSGAASKQQIQRMVMELLSLEEKPPVDAADALAAAICAAHRNKLAALGVKRRSGSGRRRAGSWRVRRAR